MTEADGTPRGDGAREGAVAQRLLKAWRGEVEAGAVYGLIAERERDPRRAKILLDLAEAESGHRRRLEARMRELGVEVPDPDSVRISRWRRMQARVAPVDRLLAAREAAESEEVGGVYGQPTGDPETDRLLMDIGSDESSHSRTMRAMIAGVTQLDGVAGAGAVGAGGAQVEHGGASGVPQPGDGAGGALGDRPPGFPAGVDRGDPKVRLDRILGREKWHSGSGGWISGAIYGANDGLAAVFGIVTGVSGATGGSEIVLTAGLAGAVASALSMATGAFLAERSTMEVAAANLDQERREIAAHPEEEREELSLMYQLKGLDRASADSLAEKVAEHPEAMLSMLAAEELGTTSSEGHPVQAALAGGLSTAAGAIVPVVPFFFVHGAEAIIAAAIVSIVAHFLVGAAKSLVTLRTWWAAGIEMTLAGVIVGGVLYAVGLALPT
ncbi:MAG: VIT1/CCC1 transporter family protein [Solirubrobacteraceae bacterium]